ncbi:DUF4189 domain-containing protein [Pseudoxanthomonas sp. UC19_8]|uniref:DUF4189 domain-containing protein n=1 Tax=Pseudoxanthomonas sp. UC19_8 TaxID=3350175 RepID=UPI0036D3BE65
MKIFGVLIINCGLFYCSHAFGQDAVQQQQQQQFQAEQNRLGYYNQQGNEIALPPRPAGKWIKTWGAIAKDSVGTEVGASVGKLSRGEAEQAALTACARGGGSSCKALFAYQNQCVAYATGLQSSGRAWEVQSSAKNIEIASSEALKGCAEKSSDCKILYTDCTDPIFQRY